MAIIYSDKYKGFAIGGAVPYYLTEGKDKGVFDYMKDIPSIDVDKLYNFAVEFAKDGRISPLSNLQNKPNYQFAGGQDKVIPPAA